MGNSYKRYMPREVKDIVRTLLDIIPKSYEILRTLSMYLKGHYYQPFSLMLSDDYKKYDCLFRMAEENFKEIITPFASEFRWLIGRIYNGIFESVNAELYYSIIRKYQPKLLIEIGSGHSTYFASDAIKTNGRGNIISIDPEPRIKLPRVVNHIQLKVEDVNVDIFKRLSENDILFIDSSHTTKEATYHVKEILPILSSGVIIPHHDIVFPYKGYFMNEPVVFGERDAVLNFYLENKNFYEIITSSPYVTYKNLQLVKEIVKSFNWYSGYLPASLWARKKVTEFSSEESAEKVYETYKQMKQ